MDDIRAAVDGIVKLRSIHNKRQRKNRKRFRCCYTSMLCCTLALLSPRDVLGQDPTTLAPAGVIPSPAPIVPNTNAPTTSHAPTLAPVTEAPTVTSPSATTIAPNSTTIAPIAPNSTTPSPSQITTPAPFTIPLSTAAPSLQPSTETPVAVGSTFNPTIQETTLTPALLPSTEAPSTLPSIATATPTVSPSLSPTIKPTRRPTISPSTTPSLTPTFITESPTISTPAPTISTNAPTNATALPSSSPTVEISESPSFASSAPSSISTTTTPTSKPSKNTASKPTSKPFRPSFKPTTAPTSIPSRHSISAQPTISAKPSSEPSSSPSAAPSSQIIPAVSVVMLLKNTTSILIESSRGSWESVTVSFLRQSIQNLQPQLQNVGVTVNITEQHLVRTGEATRRRERRELQQETISSSVPLQISFDTFLSYTSLSNYQRSELVGKSFNSAEKRAQYVGMLQRTNDDVFVAVTNVQVLVNNVLVPDEEEVPATTQSSKSEFPTAIVAAAAGAGGFLLIFSIVLFFVCRGKNKKEKQGKELTHASPTITSGPDRIPLSTEIVMEPQDDISTLGDPMFPGSMGMLMNGLERDENTASITDDYDYSRQYRMAPHQQSESSLTRDRFESVDDSAKDSSDLSKLGLGKMSESFFSDDASFEEQFVDPDERFEVLAPSGKLGMVIDTPSGGVPVVHAIKDSSVLADTVRVGDRLISVDGDDCTAMTAMQVSKLISLKANNSTRTLVFMRSRPGAEGLT